MVGRRQGEQRWRGSLMAVINDNGAEESRDTGAAYIIPSHHCLFSANQHTTARLVRAHTRTHTHECAHTHTHPSSALRQRISRRFFKSLWLPVDDSQARKWHVK